MRNTKFFAIIICILVAVSLFGCGEFNLGDLGDLGNMELPFGENPFGENPFGGNPPAAMTTEAITAEATIETFAATTAAPEETWQVVWQTEAPQTTADYGNGYYEPVQTEAQTYYDGSCNHMHNQEAEAHYQIYGGREQYYQDAEYLRTHRLVIASGGLNLRDKPSSSGKVLTLIPEGEIVNTFEYRSGWANVYYNGEYGWCSMEFLFDPFLYPEVDGYPIAYATVYANKGVELVTDRRCYDDPSVTITIPNSAGVSVYKITGTKAYVSYKGIYGYCSTDYLAF